VADKPVAAGAQREYFSFGGTGSEYFRIWIVNLLLTVLTLGIYSAWAKVRRNRYIYGNTGLLDGRFDYHAKPLAILFGRAIAIAGLVIYVLAQSMWPLVAPFLALLLFALVPWLIVRARLFNMRYTSYRNIRFGFEPAYGESYRVIYWYGFLTIITLGIAAPYAHYKRNRFIVNNTRYGNLPLSMSEGSGAFFFAYFLAMLAGAVIILPLLGFFAGAVTSMQSENGGSPVSWLSVLPFIVGGASYYVIGKFLSAAVLRATVNASCVGEAHEQHQLGSDWSLNQLLFIYVTNFFAMVCSLGLLTPWAQMREARYLMKNMWVDVRGDLKSVVARQTEDVSSLGEEIGDVFDVDIGL